MEVERRVEYLLSVFQAPSAQDAQRTDAAGRAARLRRGAARKLLVENGDAAFPGMLAILRQNVPAVDPPPWTPRIRNFRAALDFMAATGSPKARTVLEELAQSDVDYVARFAQGYLKYLRTGVAYPLKHRPLIQQSQIGVE